MGRLLSSPLFLRGGLMMRSWPLAFIALLIAAPVRAATYYVATTGNDANSCATAQSTSTPKQTIRNAVTCLAAGDTLYIRGGTYAESLQWFGWPGGTQGTSWPTAITISAYPGESVSIKPPAFSDFVLVMRGSASGATDAPKYIIFNGITFDGSSGLNHDVVKITAWDPTGVVSNAPSHHIRFTNSRITGTLGVGNSNGILITWGSDGVEIIDTEIDHIGNVGPPVHQCIYGAAHDLLVDRAHVHHCAGYGMSNISSYAGQDANNHIIRNSRVHDNGQLSADHGGINEGEGTGHQIYNNIVYNHPNRGIILRFNVGPGSNGAKIYNNTVYNTIGTGIEIGPNETNAIVRNNISYANGTNYINSGSGTTASNNSFDSVNPLFVNTLLGDFRLQATSPLMDAGVPLSEVTTDYSGIRRPQGATYDIGAYERAVQGTPPAPPTGLRIVSQ